MFGEMIPMGGGDPIPLVKKRLRVGRRDSCDIVLNYANISGNHCLLEIVEGYWFIKDLRSRNGIKVDGKRILTGVRKRINPDSVVSIAKHQFQFNYEPTELGAYGTPPQDEQMENFFSQSLLDRAGLNQRDGKSGDE